MIKSLIIFAIFAFSVAQAQEFCAQCSSSQNEFDCVFEERLDQFINTCDNATGLCFSRITHDGLTQRGCASNLNGTECEGELCRTCALISGGSTACNTAVFPIDRLTCYSCTGGENSTCASLNATDVHPTVCPLYRQDDRCFATRSGGNVTRGCVSSAQNRLCDNNACNICTGHGCNNLDWGQLNSAFAIKSTITLIISAILIIFIGNINN